MLEKTTTLKPVVQIASATQKRMFYHLRLAVLIVSSLWIFEASALAQNDICKTGVARARQLDYEGALLEWKQQGKKKSPTERCPFSYCLSPGLLSGKITSNRCDLMHQTIAVGTIRSRSEK